MMKPSTQSLGIFLRSAAFAALFLVVSIPGARAAGAGAKTPYNIILVLSDQQEYDLRAKGDYTLPARERLERLGTTFRNHYVASAMCTPSRAALLSGQPPQVNGVFDQMQTGYV